MVIGLADVDWHSLTLHTERQRLRRITRNTASSRKIIGGAERHYSQNGSRSLGEIHQAVKNLVQCAVPTRCNQQIHFACFGHKSPRISLLPRHSHIDVMPAFSLPTNCGPEGVISGHFPVENQLNPFAPSFRIHRNKRGYPRSVRLFKKNRQAAEQEMRGNSQSLRSGGLIFLAPLTEMRMFSFTRSKTKATSCVAI